MGPERLLKSWKMTKARLRKQMRGEKACLMWLTSLNPKRYMLQVRKSSEACSQPFFTTINLKKDELRFMTVLHRHRINLFKLLPVYFLFHWFRVFTQKRSRRSENLHNALASTRQAQKLYAQLQVHDVRSLDLTLLSQNRHYMFCHTEASLRARWVLRSSLKSGDSYANVHSKSMNLEQSVVRGVSMVPSCLWRMDPFAQKLDQ